MTSPDVVIAQKNPEILHGMAKDLHAYFTRVDVAESASELHNMLLRNGARVAVLDLEVVGLDEVSELAHEFSDLTIVCTHRSPDEKRWMEALNAGAVDFCHPRDLRSILRATRASQRPLARAA